jgi:glutamate-5-semialdehyde dehydrogenase
MKSISIQCEAAYKTKQTLAKLPTATKNAAIAAMAAALIAEQSTILTANAEDIALGVETGLSAALRDRLRLTSERIQGIADSLLSIHDLQDPIGDSIQGWQRPNGIRISQIRVPLGVVGMIYEARPNVTADAIGLCIKTGNAVVLRGSSSAYRSNRAMVTVMNAAAVAAGIPDGAIQLLEDCSREGVQTFVKMTDYLDLVIPRGGAGLIQEVVQHATVPAIETGVGNCHIFVDADADHDQALAIIHNAKTQRPSVCNSAETLLVHRDIAAVFLPKLAIHLGNTVSLRGCSQTCQILPTAMPATDADWDTEYLDLILAIRVVDDVHTAVTHIAQHGTLHSEAILSNNYSHIQLFIQSVDAAAVLVNASTRFVDGGEFGFGAEIGISTQKLHVRGPMGLLSLTTGKYVVEGNGQIRL